MTENELISYFGEDIKATLKDGKIFKGHVSSFEWGKDSENGESCITIDKDFEEDILVDLKLSEIESIEII